MDSPSKDFRSSGLDELRRGGPTILVQFGLVLIVWMMAESLWVRPDGIGASWREVDTQAIARNFHREGIHPLYPRIDWRGDGPGYVETELPLYAATIAVGMRLVGEHEWIGQALSLLFGAGCGLVFFLFGRRRFGDLAAFTGACVLLSSRLWVSLSISVMPDMASTFFVVLGFFWFVRYAERGSTGALVAASFSTAFAALLKASALALGVVQFSVMLLGSRQRLVRSSPWLAWGFVLAVAGTHLWHANGLYRDYGNTFGVLSGGDTKFPTLDSLLSPRIHLNLAQLWIQYGAGVIGALALLGLALARRLGPVEIALAFGNAAGLYISLRYSSDLWAGPHYHVLGALCGAYWTARATQELLGSVPALGRLAVRAWPAVLVLGLLGARFVVFGAEERARRVELQSSPTVALGRVLAPLVLPADRIVVRSPKPSIHPTWNRPNNFEEPTVFYAAGAKGFSIPADSLEPAILEGLVRRGADFYVESGDRLPAVELYRWLGEHAELVTDEAFGRIWRLPAVAPMESDQESNEE